MAKQKQNKPAGAQSDPTILPALDRNKRGESIHVIVETPKGSRNKYAYDPERGVFELKKVLPEGMDFPHNFGFVPSTEAEDGDPDDVLILMDQPAFPGCLIECRLLGVIQGEQTEDGKKFRNDRLIAVCAKSHTYSDLRDIKDLNKNFVKELENFFVSFHKLDDIDFKCIGIKGEKTARKLLKSHLKKAA
jgi:inorganic pyrophosphatase